jgi:hypothetical protein
MVQVQCLNPRWLYPQTVKIAKSFQILIEILKKRKNLELHNINTPRTSIHMTTSRTSPMSTGNEIKPNLDDVYLPYLDDQIDFDPNAMNTHGPSNYAFEFDPNPLEFLSPPGSGYTSPIPAYMNSTSNDLHLMPSYESGEPKTDPDPEYAMSPYAAFCRRADLHATSSTPDQESFLSSDTCPETPDGSVKVIRPKKFNQKNAPS